MAKLIGSINISMLRGWKGMSFKILFWKGYLPVILPVRVKHTHFSLGLQRVPASVISTLLRPSLETASLIGWVAYKDEFAIIEIQTQAWPSNAPPKDSFSLCLTKKKVRCIKNIYVEKRQMHKKKRRIWTYATVWATKVFPQDVFLGCVFVWAQ